MTPDDEAYIREAMFGEDADGVSYEDLLDWCRELLGELDSLRSEHRSLQEGETYEPIPASFDVNAVWRRRQELKAQGMTDRQVGDQIWREREPRETEPKPPEDEATLRELLAFAYSGAALYVDDGELQDSRRHPFIDFRRDSASEIKRKMTVRGERQFDWLLEPIHSTADFVYIAFELDPDSKLAKLGDLTDEQIKALEDYGLCFHVPGPKVDLLNQLKTYLEDEFYSNAGANGSAEGFRDAHRRGSELGLWPEEELGVEFP